MSDGHPEVRGDDPPVTGRSRDWTLRRRLGQTFGVLGVVVLLLVGAVVTAAILFTGAGNEVIYRWQPAAAKVTEITGDLVDQETGLRGYALTGDRASLEPYLRYETEQRRDRAALARHLGDDERLQARLAALDGAVARWRAEIAVPAIAALDAGRRAAAVRVVAGTAARQRFDGIRARAADLGDEMSRRVAEARDRRRLDGTVFLVSGVALLLVVVAAALSLRRGLDRWILRPVAALAGQTREVASGATHRSIVSEGPRELTALGNDVEAMRRQIAAELSRVEEVGEELRRRGAELARSNEDLQQFAYVASHDLSEPLRKVANFCQLLERQYGDRLDERGHQYIAFAVDGAKRMQVLITDLLALSRVGRTTETFEQIDLDRKLDVALDNLEQVVTASGAEIRRLTPLPTVPGDRALLVSLLENLVGNAIKYRRPDVTPVVELSAEHDTAAGVWTITVADNGIGIDPQYAERIFAVFQRLHLRDEYGGTGIGLALCRRIVEFHGGRIWLATAVESAATPHTPSAGATFRFTLPEAVRAQSRDRTTEDVAGRPAGGGRPG